MSFFRNLLAIGIVSSIVAISGCSGGAGSALNVDSGIKTFSDTKQISLDSDQTVVLTNTFKRAMVSAIYYPGQTYFGFGSVSNYSAVPGAYTVKVFGQDVSFSSKSESPITFEGSTANYTIRRYETDSASKTSFDGYYVVSGNARTYQLYFKGRANGSQGSVTILAATTSPTVNISVREEISGSTSGLVAIDVYQVKVYADLNNDGFNEYYEGNYNQSSGKVDVKNQSGTVLFSIDMVSN